MRDPIRIKLDYLASTYGIDPLGFAYIEYVDGKRVLVLEPSPRIVDANSREMYPVTVLESATRELPPDLPQSDADYSHWAPDARG